MAKYKKGKIEDHKDIRTDRITSYVIEGPVRLDD